MGVYLIAKNIFDMGKVSDVFGMILAGADYTEVNHYGEK